jgi:hypothetical protein
MGCGVDRRFPSLQTRSVASAPPISFNDSAVSKTATFNSKTNVGLKSQGTGSGRSLLIGFDGAAYKKKQMYSLGYLIKLIHKYSSLIKTIASNKTTDH